MHQTQHPLPWTYTISLALNLEQSLNYREVALNHRQIENVRVVTTHVGVHISVQ